MSPVLVDECVEGELVSPASREIGDVDVTIASTMTIN